MIDGASVQHGCDMAGGSRAIANLWQMLGWARSRALHVANHPHPCGLRPTTDRGTERIERWGHPMETKSRSWIAGVESLFTAVCGLAFLLAFASFVWGVGVLLSGLWHAMFGDGYPMEPFWRFAGLSSPPHKVLEWDRTWYLAIIIPLALGGVGMAVSEGLEDSRRTPRERARLRSRQREGDRNFAKQEDQRRSSARMRASRKPMSGWRRLWIALSLVFGLPLFLVQFSEDREAYAYHYASSVLAGFDVETHGGLIFREASAKRPDLNDCNTSSINMSRAASGAYEIRCTRSVWSAMFPALWFAILPAIAMAGVGLAVRWIYRGFRPAP
jgi:hypothetical protein